MKTIFVALQTTINCPVHYFNMARGETTPPLEVFCISYHHCTWQCSCCSCNAITQSIEVPELSTFVCADNWQKRKKWLLMQEISGIAGQSIG